MKFDKLSKFSNGQTIPATASTNTTSGVIDLRNCGQIGIDGFLKIYAQIKGAANSTGSITTILETSAGHATPASAEWTQVASAVQDGDILAAIALPLRGLKRFIRLKYAVGSTALSAAVAVESGLVDAFDMEDLPPIADPFTAADPAVDGEAFCAALAPQA